MTTYNGDKHHLPHVFIADERNDQAERRSLIVAVQQQQPQQSIITKDDDNDDLDVVSAPTDRYNIVYFILLLHGIGALMPWNMFITAFGYFTDYKLVGTPYAGDFLSYLGICSQLPNFLLNLINMFVQVKGSLSCRIVNSLLVVAAICIVTIILAIVDSSEWKGAFFFLTMFTVVILNGANGIYQNSIYGLSADFPAHFSNAIVLGNNLSGTFVAIVNIIAIWLAPSKRLAAIYYFIAALFTIFACFDSYFILPYCKFYRYYNELGIGRRVAESALEQNRVTDSGSIMKKLTPFIDVFKQAWVQLFNVFFVFFVTLTIFPAIQGNIEQINPSESFISQKYFTPVTTFLLFNVFAAIGSFSANFVQLPGPDHLWLPVSLRLLMVPYFMLCNYQPLERTWPVYVQSDAAYIAMAILMAVSSGYFSSLAMIVVDEPKARTAGMMSALFLVLGIFIGVWFSLVVSYVNKNLGPIVLMTNSTGYDQLPSPSM